MTLGSPLGGSSGGGICRWIDGRSICGRVDGRWICGRVDRRHRCAAAVSAVAWIERRRAARALVCARGRIGPLPGDPPLRRAEPPVRMMNRRWGSGHQRPAEVHCCFRPAQELHVGTRAGLARLQPAKTQALAACRKRTRKGKRRTIMGFTPSARHNLAGLTIVRLVGAEKTAGTYQMGGVTRSRAACPSISPRASSRSR